MKLQLFQVVKSIKTSLTLFFGQWNNQQITTLPDNSSDTEIEGKEVKNFMGNGWFTIDETSNIVVSILQSNELRETNEFSEYYDIEKKAFID